MSETTIFYGQVGTREKQFLAGLFWELRQIY
jgi:hypothetical protein